MDKPVQWEPVEGIVTPVARALLQEDHQGLVVTLVFSEIVDGPHSDLRINFGRIPAYTVHEELVHPVNGSPNEAPALGGKWEGYTYPLLLVQDSEWLHSFSSRQLIRFAACIHYRLSTLDQIVNVLCNKLPQVTWIEPGSSG